MVVLALDEARSLGHDHIGSEHLLLGLLRLDDELVELLGDPADVRRRVVEIVGEGASRSNLGGQIPSQQRQATRSCRPARTATGRRWGRRRSRWPCSRCRTTPSRSGRCARTGVSSTACATRSRVVPAGARGGRVRTGGLEPRCAAGARDRGTPRRGRRVGPSTCCSRSCSRCPISPRGRSASQTAGSSGDGSRGCSTVPSDPAPTPAPRHRCHRVGPPERPAGGQGARHAGGHAARAARGRARRRCPRGRGPRGDRGDGALVDGAGATTRARGCSTASRVRPATAIARAVDEARLLDHAYVGTEHLLLALIQDDARGGRSRARRPARRARRGAHPGRAHRAARRRAGARREPAVHGAFEARAGARPAGVVPRPPRSTPATCCSASSATARASRCTCSSDSGPRVVSCGVRHSRCWATIRWRRRRRSRHRRRRARSGRPSRRLPRSGSSGWGASICCSMLIGAEGASPRHSRSWACGSIRCCGASSTSAGAEHLSRFGRRGWCGPCGSRRSSRGRRPTAGERGGPADRARARERRGRAGAARRGWGRGGGAAGAGGLSRGLGTCGHWRGRSQAFSGERAPPGTLPGTEPSVPRTDSWLRGESPFELVGNAITRQVERRIENVCGATCTRGALVRRPALFQNPQFSFRALLSLAWVGRGAHAALFLGFQVLMSGSDGEQVRRAHGQAIRSFAWV